MKLYVLLSSVDHEGDTIEGVYSSLERAEAEGGGDFTRGGWNGVAEKRLDRKEREFWKLADRLIIEEHELDAPR